MRFFVEGNKPPYSMLIGGYYARLTGLTKEDSWLVLTGMWLKSRPDERVACDEYIKHCKHVASLKSARER